jgi:hypothetical protein
LTSKTTGTVSQYSQTYLLAEWHDNHRKNDRRYSWRLPK